MTLPVPKQGSHCGRCGTSVTPGLRYCAVCAERYHIAPDQMFTLQLGAQPRPPYEKAPTPTDTGDDHAASS